MRREKNLLFLPKIIFKKLVNVKLYGKKNFLAPSNINLYLKKNMEKIGKNQIENNLSGKK